MNPSFDPLYTRNDATAAGRFACADERVEAHDGQSAEVRATMRVTMRERLVAWCERVHAPYLNEIKRRELLRN
jgi:hypothetical protein